MSTSNKVNKVVRLQANAPIQLFDDNGNHYSIEVEIMQSSKSMPIVDIHTSLLTGEVKDPEVLFKAAYDAAYAAAKSYLYGVDAEAKDIESKEDTARIIVLHEDLHNGVWGSPSLFITDNNTNIDIVSRFVEKWTASLQSGEKWIYLLVVYPLNFSLCFISKRSRCMQKELVQRKGNVLIPGYVQEGSKHQGLIQELDELIQELDVFEPLQLIQELDVFDPLLLIPGLDELIQELGGVEPLQVK